LISDSSYVIDGFDRQRTKYHGTAKNAATCEPTFQPSIVVKKYLQLAIVKFLRKLMNDGSERYVVTNEEEVYKFLEIEIEEITKNNLIHHNYSL
jgi:hypothetical protein